MADLFDGLLVTSPNGGGFFLLHKGVAYKLDSLDTTGFDAQGAYMVRALQPDSLVMFQGAVREIDGVVARIDDLHDAYLDGDSCYVVSTRHNEIVRLDHAGQERRRWTFPGEVDAWHINCITRWNGRLVFSAFTDRQAHRAYKEPPFEVGFVQDLETGERPITGLFQPHSLVAGGRQLMLANSGSFEIHAYDAEGRLLRRQTLGGYTRGIAHHDNVIYVGLSKTRNVETEGLSSAVLVALDATTWLELGRLSLPVDEIYQVSTVRDSEAVAMLARIAAHANGRIARVLTRIEPKLVQAEQARDQLAARLEDVVRDRDEKLRDGNRRIYGLIETVHGKDIQIQNRDEIIRDKDVEIARRDEIIGSKEAQLAGREEVLREGDRRIHDLLDTVHGKDLQIQNRDAIIFGKDSEIQRRDDLVRDKDALLQQRARLAHDAQTELHRLGDILRMRDAQIQSRAATARTKDGVINQLGATLREKDEAIRVRDARLDAQGLAYAELTGRAHGLSSQVGQLSAESEHLAVELGEREAWIEAMKSSRSWRVTRPMRALKLMFQRNKVPDVALPAATVGAQSPPSEMSVPESNDKAGSPSPMLSALHSPDTNTFQLVATRVPAVPAVPAATRLDLRGCRKPVDILTTTHCTYIAELIVSALARAGISAKIIHGMPEGGYDDVPHFVICPQMFEKLPGLYVSFQMEQSVSSRWFTDEYVHRLENSFAVLDYSLVNIEKLQELGLHPQQIYYTPIDYLPDYARTRKAIELEYDVLFYGDDQNDRRRRFLTELGKVCKVKVQNNLFGKELYAEMAKAKLVVNIHYYAGALLETTRIWECLSMGHLVVSERSSDMDQQLDLAELVDFVDIDDVAGMAVRVRYWLDNESLRRQRIEKSKKALEAKFNRFDYHFYRFLLASDNISFEQFWALVGNRIELAGDKLCLSLPEWLHRIREFDRDNCYGFVNFTGLRHSKGWLGCAMSYKLMIMLARQQGFPKVTICEDDVEFPHDFGSRWESIQWHLTRTSSRWDVFSGLMANLHEDARILDVCVDDGVQYIATDKLISMVFNVYASGVYDAITSWDECNHDVNTNTIDRYLENTAHIRVVTTQPFLVGHKEGVQSTLWGFQNTQYNELIVASRNVLQAKVAKFEQNAESAPEAFSSAALKGDSDRRA